MNSNPTDTCIQQEPPIRRVAVICAGAVRDDMSNADVYLGVFVGASEEEIVERAAAYGDAAPEDIVLIDPENEPPVEE